MLDEASVFKYLPDFKNKTRRPKFIDSPARYADVVRIALIAEYGGWWLDATIFAYTSVETLVGNRPNADFVGYYIDNFRVDPRYPVIENWMFGAPLKSNFARLWKDEFFSIDRKGGVDAYIADVEMSGVNVSGITMKTYLVMHVAAQVVIQRQLPSLDKLVLHSVYDGPFKLQGAADWDGKRIVETVCGSGGNEYKKSFLKLRGIDRTALEDADVKCFWAS